MKIQKCLEDSRARPNEIKPDPVDNIIKNEKIRVTLCENAAGALYTVNKMCVDGQMMMTNK